MKSIALVSFHKNDPDPIKIGVTSFLIISSLTFSSPVRSGSIVISFSAGNEKCRNLMVWKFKFHEAPHYLLDCLMSEVLSIS